MTSLIPEEMLHFLQNYKQPIIRPDKFQPWSNDIFKVQFLGNHPDRKHLVCPIRDLSL